MDNLEFNLRAIAEELEDNGSPTTGENAEKLWRWLSRPDWLSVSKAKEIYLLGGYKPFSGYPLVRK